MRWKNTGQGWARDRERGQALILVMLVLLVVAVLGTGAITLAASHRQTAARQRNLVQAYYAADAGVERALVKIRNEPGWFNGLPFGVEQLVFSDVPYAGGKIQKVTLKKAPAGIATRVEITSVGIFGPQERPLARKTLNVSVLVSAASDLLKGVSILPEQPTRLNIGGNFSLQPAQNVDGVRFVLNGDLDLGGSSEIVGDVYVSGTIKGSDKIRGSAYDRYAGIPTFPVIDEEWYKTEAQSSGHYYEDDAVLGSRSGTTLYAGVYFAEGTIEISGTYSGRAVIVAKGGITVDRDLRASSGNDFLVLVSLADVSIENSSVDAVVIAAGAFQAWGNATLYGGVIARQFVLGGSKQDKDGKKDGEGQGGGGKVTIVCNPQLIMQNLPQDVLQGVSSSIKIASWREGYPVL